MNTSINMIFPDSQYYVHYVLVPYLKCMFSDIFFGKRYDFAVFKEHFKILFSKNMFRRCSDTHFTPNNGDVID